MPVRQLPLTSFTCGLRNRATQKKLLTEKDLTWKMAVDIANAMESADKQANALRNEASSSSINKVNENKPRQTRHTEHRRNDQENKPCFRCGENHTPQSCRFKNQNCHFCKKQGHIERVCKKQKGSGKPRHDDRNTVRYVEDGKDSNNLGDLFHVAFCALKDRLSAAPVLTHFRSDLPLKLDTDASNYGIGAVISHIMPNGEERPIAFASRTLSKSERNYAQIEKEALKDIGNKNFYWLF